MIVATPVPIPVTSPPATDAIAVLLLDHDGVPPVASLNKVTPPTHIVVVPVIGAGLVLIVLNCVAEQPLANV